jgi:hypothetical protein
MTDQKEFPDDAGESVPDPCPDAEIDSESAPGPQRRRGAPPGNKNALKHGLFTRGAVALRRRRTFEQAAQDEIEQLLDSLGLADDTLALRIGRRMAAIEVEIATLTKYVTQRGRMDKKGTLKPAYAALLDLQRQDLESCRRLIEQLVEVSASKPPDPNEDVLYVCEYSDGSTAATSGPFNSAGQAPTRQEPPQAVLPLGETASTLKTADVTSGVLSQRGEQAEKSLVGKLKRHLARQSEPEEPPPSPLAARDDAWRSGRDVPGMRSYYLD